MNDQTIGLLREIDARLALTTSPIARLGLMEKRATLLGDAEAAARLRERMWEVREEPNEATVAFDFREANGRDPTEQEIESLLLDARAAWKAEQLVCQIVSRFREMHGREPTGDELKALADRGALALQQQRDETGDDDSAVDDTDQQEEGAPDAPARSKAAARATQRSEARILRQLVADHRRGKGRDPSDEELAKLRDLARELALERTGRKELLGGVEAHVDVSEWSPRQLPAAPSHETSWIDRRTARMPIAQEPREAAAARTGLLPARERHNPAPGYRIDPVTFERTLITATDLPLCADHGHHIGPERDLCPIHFAMWVEATRTERLNPWPPRRT